MGGTTYQRTWGYYDGHLFRREESFGVASEGKSLLSSNVCNADVLTVDSIKPAKIIKPIDTKDIKDRDQYFLANWN